MKKEEFIISAAVFVLIFFTAFLFLLVPDMKEGTNATLQPVFAQVGQVSE